jgi:hypothetical protein
MKKLTTKKTLEQVPLVQKFQAIVVSTIIIHDPLICSK